MHITGTVRYNRHLRSQMCEQTQIREPSHEPCLPKHAALLKWPVPLIGYFQLLLMTLLYIRRSVLKCFKANMNFPLFSGPLQTGYWCLLDEGKSLLAGLRWGGGGVKIGEGDSPGYCSPLMRPGCFPESILRTCIHRHSQTHGQTQILEHYKVAAVNNLRQCLLSILPADLPLFPSRLT